MRAQIGKLFRIVDAALRKILIVKNDWTIERFGSDYGGWDIVTNNLNKDSTVYSFGIGEDASFDIDLISRFGLVVHGFDPTPKSIKWVDEHVFCNNFVFHEYGLADFDGQVCFNPPDNPEHVSHTILDRRSTADRAIIVPVKKLDTIIKELGHDVIAILKMDIEGAEYQVIDYLSKTNIRPAQLLVEFHHHFPSTCITKTWNAIRKLRKMGYNLFAVSETGYELCFIYKK